MQSPHHENTLLSSINSFLVYGSLVIVPLLFFPFVENVFETPKMLWILFCLVVGAISWAVQLFRSKEFSLSGHSFLLPLVFMIVSILASTLFSPIVFSENFTGLIGQIFFLSLWAIISISVIKKINSATFLQIALAIGIVLSLITLLQLFDLGPTLILNKVFNFRLAEKFQFTPTGSPLLTLSILIPILLATAADIIFSRDIKNKVFEVVASLVILASIGLHIFFLFPGKADSPVLLPFSANWIIAVDTLKSFKQMAVGYGPVSFADAYTKTRPVELNTTLFWNVIFQTGSDTPLTLIVTIGLLGLFAWVLLFFQTIRLTIATPNHDKGIAVLTLSTLVVQLFLPPNLVLLTLQTLAMIVWIVSLKTHEHHSVKEMLFQFASLKLRNQQDKELSLSPVISYLGGGLIALISIASLLHFTKNAIAEYYFARSMVYLSENKANETYQAQQQAIKLRPFFTGYHRAYAQTNFAIANSLSSKQDPTDEDRQNVAQLMQQAVREIRLAAQLNPLNSQNWKIMAEIYRSLVGSVKDAEQFTQAAYVQAIQLNPYDPSLRTDLGGLYVQMKNYEQGAALFQQAAQLKPDFANAYYNWGKTLEMQERYEPAVEAYKQTLRLVEQNKENPNVAAQIEQIKKELDAAQDKMAAQQKAAKPNTEPKEEAPAPQPSEISSEPKEIEPPATTEDEETLLNKAPTIPETSDSSSSATPTP